MPAPQTCPSRRQFLQTSAMASLWSLAGPWPAGTPTAAADAHPALDAASATTVTPDPTDRRGRVLVLLQLAGGNDGLNTVVPREDDAYFRARPGLGLRPAQTLKLSNEFGLHPALGGLKSLWDSSRLAIIQGVGYPRPDRSHFRSMDYWHAARFDDPLNTGWIGRTLDAQSAPFPMEALALGLERLPLACTGAQSLPTVLKRFEDFRLKAAVDGTQPLLTSAWQQFATVEPSVPVPADSALDFLRRSARSAVESLQRLDRQPALAGNGPFPSTRLAQQLRMVAHLIAADWPASVYFVSLDGFDTHAQQLGGHAALLGELGAAVSAFFAELDRHHAAERVLLTTFSEFGRRLAENGSLGTDHGAASVQFAVSGGLQGGWFGAPPSLTDLEDGDPRFTTDFRRVYATLLERWLKVPSHPALGTTAFEPLDFVTA